MFGVLSQGSYDSISSTQFWDGPSSTGHFVQVYDHDNQLLEALERYFLAGLRAGESVIAIATASHRRELESRLADHNIDVDRAKCRNDYIALDAGEVMGTFLKDGWPDEDRLRTTLSAVLARARKDHNKLRIFGEVVAVLWGLGQPAATLRLERLWNAVLKGEGIPLFCAYPSGGFNDSTLKSLDLICSEHTSVLANIAGR